MNKLFSLSLAGALLLGLSAAPIEAQVQNPVTTGVVEKISPETGVMTVRTQQTNRPMTFYGVDKAMLVNTKGTQPALSEIGPGTAVTIQYATRGNQWYVDKITYGEMAAQTGAVTPGTGAAPAPQSLAPTVSGRTETLQRNGGNNR